MNRDLRAEENYTEPASGVILMKLRIYVYSAAGIDGTKVL